MSSCQLTLVCVKQLSVCASESFPITANVPYDAVLSFGFRACTKKPRNCELSFPESVTARQTVFMSFIVSVIIINTKNCRLSIVLTATDQKPQKSLKRWYYPARDNFIAAHGCVWPGGVVVRNTDWQQTDGSQNCLMCPCGRGHNVCVTDWRCCACVDSDLQWQLMLHSRTTRLCQRLNMTISVYRQHPTDLTNLRWDATTIHSCNCSCILYITSPSLVTLH